MLAIGRWWVLVLMVGAVLALELPARGVVYLGDKSLESMIVVCDAIGVGTVEDVSVEGDRAVVAVNKALKGEFAEWTVMRGVTAGGKAKLVAGERVMVFLKKDAAGGGRVWRMEARLPLKTEVEEKVALACYEEVRPWAGVLADLADRKKDVDGEKVREAVAGLAESKNAYVQIIMGRLMGGPLAARVDAAGFARQIAAGLKSKHFEYQRGACVWAGMSKDKALMEPLREAVLSADTEVRRLAREAMRKIEPGAATQGAGVRSIKGFLPSRDGFRFVNNFAGLPVPTTLLDKPGQGYGLCGGMSFAAADYFVRERAVPGRKDVPEKGETLWAYLYQRQLDSLGYDRTGKFIEWMKLPARGKESAAWRTVAEAGTVAMALDDGEPAMLGLVTGSAKEGASLFDNHQVMAFAYKHVEGKWTIRVYDPNWPGDDRQVVVVEQVGDEVKVGHGREGGRMEGVKGFFEMAWRGE